MPDQRPAAPVSPTGRRSGAEDDRTQQGAFLTTAQGGRLTDTDHSLKAGERGPTLLQDHHLREEITHFDHERIPDRVVHARGAAAHGTFTAYGSAAGVSRAAFLAEGAQTPVFTSMRPSPTRTARSPRHRAAHDTFWDFVSLHTEAQHHATWQMSDRGIPRSYRMMEGFGIHTFRLVNEAGETSLVKLHWKPKLGVHSLVWDEAQIVNGADPDFHRRDLADAIEAGASPEWELGSRSCRTRRTRPSRASTCSTRRRSCPRSSRRCSRSGGVTDDPLLQGRLFSYLDTRITRLGGPNFGQLPINRPHAPVNDMFRDGMHQTADHFSQPRLFWRSLTTTEQDHVVSGYTFELGRCYEEAVRVRQVESLARIDADLATRVAHGLGLQPPPEQDVAVVEPSPALSQLGRRWPVDGRTVGIVVDGTTGVEEVRLPRRTVHEAGLVPLIIAPTGVVLGDDPLQVSTDAVDLMADHRVWERLTPAG